MTTAKTKVTRRRFVEAAAAVAAFTIVKPGSARGTAAASKLTLGIVGVGGRGTFVGSRFAEHPDIQITAIADLYDDKLTPARETFKVPERRCYRGFDACKELVTQDVDIVLITTPPFYHATHFEAAVGANKHAYVEKPLSVDVPGCRRIIAAGEAADTKGLTVVAGLQRRYGECYRSAKDRIDRGDVGTIVQARAQWLGGDLSWARGEKAPGMSEEEYQIRHWYFWRWLSGDMICEQNVHNIDVCNWFIGSHPDRVAGYTGRKARTDVGDVNDHYNLVFEYPGRTHLSYLSSQFQVGWGDVSEQFFGTKGSIDISDDPRGAQVITGANPWKYEGPNGNQRHVSNAVAAMVRSIRGIAEHRNDSRYGAESTITAIMGRLAASERREVTWKEIWESREVLQPGG